MMCITRTGRRARQTIFMSVLLGLVSSLYSTYAVASALTVTGLVTAALVLWTLQTRVVVSVWAPFLYAMVWVLLGFGLLRLMFPYSPLTESVYARYAY